MKNKILTPANISYAILLLVAVFLPNVLSKYKVHLLVLMCIWLIAAIGLNLLIGYIGKMSFAHAALMGVAGYTSALISQRSEIPWILGAAIGVVLSGLLGLLIGVVTLRLQGHFLAIVTLAFGEIYTLIVITWEKMTNGSMGVKGIEFPNIFGYYFEDPVILFYLFLALVLCTFWVAHRIVSSQFGTKMKAIREDEDLAECLGIPIVRIKVITFTISSMIAGVAGVLYSHYIRYISPDCFTGDDSTLLVLMVILGGAGFKIAPLFGTLIVILLPQVLYVINDTRMIWFGVIIILVMHFMPGGLMGLANDIIKKVRGKKRNKSLAYDKKP